MAKKAHLIPVLQFAVLIWMLVTVPGATSQATAAETMQNFGELQEPFSANGLNVTAYTELLKRMEASITRKIDMTYFQTESLQAIYSVLLPIQAPLPTFRDWAISPDFGSSLLRAVFARRPQLVLEFGSGVSTLLSAYAMKKMGYIGKIVSVDHDAYFTRRSQETVKMHGLDDFIEIVHIPLKDLSLGDVVVPWYDTELFGTLLQRLQTPIDLLVVDGPPASCPGDDCLKDFTRYPALVLSWEHLSAEAIIMLDDARREANVMQEWLQRLCCFNWSLDEISEKGIGIMERRPQEELSRNTRRPSLY